MLALSLASVLLTACFTAAIPTASNIKDGARVASLPDGWDQTKEDAQSLFFNKNDKNDLEPYPLAIIDQGADQALENSGSEVGLGEPPAPALYDAEVGARRKRGSGTKVGGAGAATKVATKSNSGKKNFKSESRQKRDSGLSASDVRSLLAAWEAQERHRKPDWSQWTDRYYGRVNDDQDEGDIWYNEPVVMEAQRDYPHSYFSEQNRLALSRYPEMDSELAQRYEDARRKRQYPADKMKRFMVAKKRSEPSFRPRDDLYSLAELLRNAPRARQDIPLYRRVVY